MAEQNDGNEQRLPIHVRALNRLCKWRVVFTGWQLGTRAKGDPEGDAVSHHREATMILRAEASAVALLLIKKGIFTMPEFEAQLAVEASNLDAVYERLFPGFKSRDDGMVMDHRAAETTKNWRR